MTFTISADDPRTIRAIEIAADADHWLRYRDRDGQEAYGVPSQGEAGRRYVVTPWSCDCADFRRNELDPTAEPRACKHVLAVRLYRELVRAQRQLPRPRQRRHLSVVPRSDEADRSPPAS
ncbi:MAG TPA: hypothetical protein VKV73_02000 [Chloroflexota bacterium]|nr:hypothetical protein [Chloroflexota bacterium]